MEGCTGRQTETHKEALLWGPSFPLHQIFDFTLGRKREEVDTVRYTDAPTTTCTTVRPNPLCRQKSLNTYTLSGTPPTRSPSTRDPQTDPPRRSSLLEHRSALGPRHLWGSCGRSLEPMSRVGKQTVWGRAWPKIQCPVSRC